LIRLDLTRTELGPTASEWPERMLARLKSARDCMPLADSTLGLIREIYPICRSITGDGVRQTLALIAQRLPLEVHEVPSGTQAFDWVVPREWNIRDAYIADSSGRRVVDFGRHSLHVMSYSVPVRARMRLAELRPHLFSLPEHPDWIPHRASYYSDNWGFCLSHRELESLQEDEYEVVIDSALQAGSLTYGECRIEGTSADEVVLFTHTCHPTLCNDNASGIALLAMLGTELVAQKPRLTYRLIFGPTTIGSIVWLSRNKESLSRIRAGLVVGLVGDEAPLTYKRSRRGDSAIDRIAANVLGQIDPASRVIDFSPLGYDERQFCSPGIDLPVGRLTRSTNGSYPEYHTSADDLSLMRVGSLAESLFAISRILADLDSNRRFINLAPHCEPQLGKRGLFGNIGGGVKRAELEQAMLWVLNQSDGMHGLTDIEAVSGLRREALERAATALVKTGLLSEVQSPPYAAGRREGVSG
jgi:aminopeptidase-like protein